MRFSVISSVSLVLLLGAAGCQPDPPATQTIVAPPPLRAAGSAAPLEKRVMARHDSLMLQTGELFTLRRRLSALRPALAGKAAQQARLDAATSATQTADNAMTDWMHAYRRPTAGVGPDSATAYYERQLRILDQVATLTQRAHDSASAVLRAFSAVPPPPPSR